MTPIIICGANGRMGTEVLKLGQDKFNIKALVSRKSFLEYKSCPNLFDALSNLEEIPVFIDFSSKDLLKNHLEACLKYKANLLLATTGHSLKNYELIKEASKSIAILVAPNTSLMAALMMAMAKIAAPLAAEIELVDIHHRHKKDAPSGTALALEKALSEVSKIKPHISSIRASEIIGEHTAYFFNDFERLELTHRVADRQVFAQGALQAAQFLFGLKPGLYAMNDVLKINS
jgi:4-hydroxy-tetrahydrodipicolinate reductase